MPDYYGPWIWSKEHQRHYAFLYAADNSRILDTLWEAQHLDANTTATTPATQLYGDDRSAPRNLPSIPTSGSSYPQTSYSSTSPLPQPHPSSRENYVAAPSSLSASYAHPQGSYAVAPPTSSVFASAQGSYGTAPLASSSSAAHSAHHSYPQTTSNGSQYISTAPDYGATGRAANNQRYHLPGDQRRVDGQASLVTGGPSGHDTSYGPLDSHSIASAQASVTTASGSPYLYQNQQTQSGFPFTSASAGQPQHTTPHMTRSQSAQYPAPRRPVTSLPYDVQSTIRSLDRRYIQTDPNEASNQESLDPRYRRVVKHHHASFFVLGRVFKMLWTEPAGQSNPGRTRNSTHFSTVLYGQTAFSEIRRFVVVRNKGDFSQCIPIQTYKGQGATKPGLVMDDHGVIHTSSLAPNLLPGENLTKYSVQVQPFKDERLEAASRVNYGKAYAVEHNVKVLEVGMILEGHRYLIQQYFDSAMQS